MLSSVKVRPKLVSIRSPHRSKGRLTLTATGLPAWLFQSAPLTEARGDGRKPPPAGPQGGVSIRSPHRSKGRRGGGPCPPRTRHVSIRSPHRSKGRRRSSSSEISPNFVFQSAPLTEARGDTAAAPAPVAWPSFNPLPSPKQGETSAAASWRSPRRCFNPLPSPKQGETHGGAGAADDGALVSIRSPHRSKGRHPRVGLARGDHPFQSAPLTEARGDPP